MLTEGPRDETVGQRGLSKRSRLRSGTGGKRVASIGLGLFEAGDEVNGEGRVVVKWASGVVLWLSSSRQRLYGRYDLRKL